mgnify:FL=1
MRSVPVSKLARPLLLLIVLIVGSEPAIAQSPVLTTDRPDKTESATVVSRGLLQVETGYLFARDGEMNGYEVPGTLLRIGLGSRAELRIGHAGVVWKEGSQGLGDSQLGAKVNLIERADGWRPEMAMLGGLSLPTGGDKYSSNGIDPSFLIAFAHELSPRLSLGYNVGARWESSAGNPERDVFTVYSMALGLGLADRLGAFFELFGDKRQRGNTATSEGFIAMDGGLTFLLTDIVQLDLYIGRGLVGQTEDVFVGTGLSFRLPR